MKHLLSKKMLMSVVLVSLMVATIACRGPAGPTRPPEVVNFESGPVLTIWPPVVSKSKGELTISGSGLVPGDGIWINVANADSGGSDVTLNEGNLVVVNEHGAFTITVKCEKALKDVVVKEQKAFVVKTLSGKGAPVAAPIVIDK